MPYQSALVGVSFRHKDVKALVADQETFSDSTLTLRREPTNAYDPLAIQVESDGTFVGYIDKDVCREGLNEDLKNGQEFRVEVVSYMGTLRPWLQITEIDVEEA